MRQLNSFFTLQPLRYCYSCYLRTFQNYCNFVIGEIVHIRIDHGTFLWSETQAEFKYYIKIYQGGN